MPERSKFRLAKVHIWARDGPVCTYGEPPHEWHYDAEYMGKTCEGVVVWEVWPLAADIGGPTHVLQHFSRTPLRGTGPLVWQWDGNHEAPTLTPSFLYYGSRPPGAGGNERDWPRIHLFLRAGVVENLSDSEADFVP